MGSSKIPSLRSLPRCFVGVVDLDVPLELPQSELDKLRKVLRLGEGSLLALLPNDGRLFVARLQGRTALPFEVHEPATESEIKLTLCQALPKGDKIDTIVRCCTEVGVGKIVLFPAERSVVRWDDSKLAQRLTRYQTIAREAAEQCFRTRVPEVSYEPSLKAVLQAFPEAIVLSESESEIKNLPKSKGDERQIVVGPEGGWSPEELKLIGERGVTLGPRVLRVDTAAIAAATLMILGEPGR